MLSRTHDNVKFVHTLLHTARKRIGEMCIHDTTLTSSSAYYNNQIFPSTILQTWTEHVKTEAFYTLSGTRVNPSTVSCKSSSHCQ